MGRIPATRDRVCCGPDWDAFLWDPGWGGRFLILQTAARLAAARRVGAAAIRVGAAAIRVGTAAIRVGTAAIRVGTAAIRVGANASCSSAAALRSARLQ